VGTCEGRSSDELAAIADDGDGDTIFAIDRVGEALLVDELAQTAAACGGIVLVAEGVAGGKLVLPTGYAEDRCRYRVIMDPIDGTRGLMYQKRPAWILTGVAPNRGVATRLADIELSVQTEIPLVKQNLCDELWAVRGGGAHAERFDRISGRRATLSLQPSRAKSIEQGFASVSRFFPGVRDELAAIDDDIVHQLLGPAPAGKAHCFEDQYLSTGGQLYELMAGHDRFIADIRPLMARLWSERRMPLGLCCHPYDICTALIAEELGVIIRDAMGGPLDYPLDVESNVTWVGYANVSLVLAIEPLLQRALRERRLIESPLRPA
jgi:fructose-1,6-bisphosphatase/inositol monophosphatase family enzyme